MCINYAKAIFERLVKDEFVLFSDNEGFELNEATSIIPLIKAIGNVLYVVFIINESISVELQKQFFMSNKNSFHCDTIIFMSLHLTKDSQALLPQISNNQFIAGLDFYNINWVVDTSSNNLVIPEGETATLLKLDILIKLALDMVLNIDEGADECLNLVQLEKEIRIKTALKINSNNAAITISIIFINFVILMMIELLIGNGGSQSESALLLFGANNYSKIVNNHEFYRLITSMFLHIGFPHYAVNSLSLYIYGSKVEKYYGKSSFFIIYILSGIVASTVSILASRVTSAGASGAIFGLLGSLIAMIVKTRKSVDGLNLYIVSMLTISSVGFGFIMPGIDNYAHIGGLVAGFTLGWFCLKFFNDEITNAM